MSESKRSPVKRKLIAGSVVAVAMVLVLSAVGIYVSFGLPAIVDLTLFSEDDAGPSRSAARRGDSPGLANSDAGQPQSIPVAQPPSAEAGVRMVDIIAFPRIVSFGNIGESQQLTVQGFYSDGSVGELEGDPTATLSYTSSDFSVAQVSSDGVVTGIRAAGADVVVRYGDFNAEVPVLVFGPVRQLPPIDPERVLEIDDDGSAIVLNRVMARLLPGYGSADAAQVAASIGGEVIFEFRTFPGYVIDFGAQTEEHLNEALAVLEADERVEYAYPDMLAPPIQATTGPGSPIYRKGQLSTPTPAPPVPDSGIGKAWDVIKKSGKNLEQVFIVVVDLRLPSKSCLDKRRSEYPKLYVEMTETLDYDRIKTDREECPKRFYGGYDDLVGNEKKKWHGAAVTSVMVSEDATYAGVVAGVSGIHYDLRFYSTEPTSRYHNPDILNPPAKKAVASIFEFYKSLDSLVPYQGQIAVGNLSIEFKEESKAENEIIDLLKKMPDVTFVVGAGNGEKEITKGKKLAGASTTTDNVVTVGGIQWDPNSQKVFVRHPDSNYGSAITVAAPFKVNAFQTRLRGHFGERKGTSFSAPLVSGTVALMKALNRDLKPVEIRKILRDTGTVITTDKGETWKILNVEAAVGCILHPSFPADLKGYKNALAKALKKNPEVFQNNSLDKLQSPCKTYLQPTSTPTPTPTPTATPTPTPTSQEDSRWSRDGAKFLKMSFYTIPSPEPVSDLPLSFADECTIPEFTDLPIEESRARSHAFLACIPEPLSVVPQQIHGYYVFLAFDTAATQENFTMPVKIQLILHNPKSGATTVFSELETTVNHSDILAYNVTRSIFDYLVILPPQYSYEIRVLDDQGVEIVSSDFSAGLSLDQYGSKLPNIQLPNIAAPLISHGLEPALKNTVDFSIDWRVVKKMAGADLLKLTWLLEFDTTEAPMNLPFAAEVRWVDVTDPDRPVVLSGAGQYCGGMVFGRFFCTASRSTGEQGYWKPGRYQVRLVDKNSGEVLAYLSFEVN